MLLTLILVSPAAGKTLDPQSQGHSFCISPVFKDCLEREDGPYEWNRVLLQRDEAHFFKAGYFDELTKEAELAPFRPRSVPLPVWEDLERQERKPDNSAITYTRHPWPSNQQKLKETVRSRQGNGSLEKIRLAEARTAYFLWWSIGSGSSLGLSPISLNVCLGEEADVDDNHAKPKQRQDRPKNQGKELLEINLATRGEEPWPILLVPTRQPSWGRHLLFFCRNLKISLHRHMLRCQDLTLNWSNIDSISKNEPSQWSKPRGNFWPEFVVQLNKDSKAFGC